MTKRTARIGSIAIVLISTFLPVLAFAGSASYTSPGWYYFSVPAYSSLTVYVSGAGGGGGGDSYGSDGYPGENSGFYASWVGSSDVMGGGGGGGGYDDNFATGGAPGGAWGGNAANTTGGGAPGAVGNWMNPGGAGGQAVSSYSPGQLGQGGTIAVYVGAGGQPTYYGSNGDNPCALNTGCDGSVTIYWSDPVDPCPSGIESYWGGGNYLLWSGVTRRINTIGYNFCATNYSGSHYFIPARTAGELQSFINAAPRLGVSIF